VSAGEGVKHDSHGGEEENIPTAGANQNPKQQKKDADTHTHKDLKTNATAQLALRKSRVPMAMMADPVMGWLDSTRAPHRTPVAKDAAAASTKNAR
jgi:hypothetical protein